MEVVVAPNEYFDDLAPVIETVQQPIATPKANKQR